MKTPQRAIFVLPPFRLGRWGFAISKDWTDRISRYKASGMWQAWQLLWFRIYRYEGVA